MCLGLDAADKDLIADWAAQGDLPTFQKMLETSANGPMTTPPGQYAGSVWPSFSTSATPARHGRYFFTQPRPGSYDYQPFLPDDLQSPPFWQALSNAGVRISLIDVPKAPQAESFNGLQVLDWGTHDRDTEFIRSFPADLGKKILARYGHDPVGRCDAASRTADGLKSLADRLCKRAETRARIIMDTISETESDLTIAVFTESHCAGHQFWHLHDPSHPEHDANIAASIGNPLKQVYSTLDTAVGDILNSVDPDTIVILFTSHGIGPHYDATYLLREVLRRLHTTPLSAEHYAVDALRNLWGKMPSGLKRRIRPGARNLINRTEAIAQKDQEFFQVQTNDNCGGIRVNLRGREPNGRVESGTAYDRLVAQLSEDLGEIVNNETGERIVKEVLRSDQLFSGPCVQDLPDLNIVWNQTAPIRAISSAKIGTIEGKYQGHRTGDHREYGFLWARGPGITPRTFSNYPSIMDIGPTLATLLGVELTGVDGVAIDLGGQD